MTDEYHVMHVEIELTPVGKMIIQLARILAEYADDLPEEVITTARDLVAVNEEHQEG